MKFQLEKFSELVRGGTRISQEAWYIEIVSNKNQVLQTEDYNFILPIKSSLSIQQVIIPPFVQRIDPIARNSKNASIELPDEIIKHFPCGMICFSDKIQNSSNQFLEQVRTNYFLPLDKSYEDLYKNYNNGHKLNLKQAARQNILVSESADIEIFVDHYQKHSHSDIPGKYKEKEMITKLISECLKRKNGKIYTAENQNEVLLACAFITIYNNRLVYLLSSSSIEGKKQFAMYAIIDEIIRQHCNSEMILDFEGSMIPGIAYFMKGFGAEEELYYMYEWNEHWVCRFKKWMRKLL